MSRKKILIYNDSQDFGGHEVMTIHMANTLAKSYEIFFLFFHRKIGEMLDEAIKKRRMAIYSPLPLAGIRSFNLKDLLTLKNVVKKINPDLTIVSQGTIELSLKGALLSKFLNIKTVSYIPLCFPSPKMGVKFGRIRDILNKKFYHLFDAFITISREQEHLIKHWNKCAKVFVLPNLVEFDNFLFNDVQTVFQKKDIIKIGVVGRISFKQKGQDKLIRIAKFLKEKGINFLILIIGDGPDKIKLENLIKKEKLEKFFQFTGWINDRKKIYSMFDLLLITSNFEGVPLNMLEAIAYNKPVIAPNVGVFKEYLLNSMLYKSIEEIPNILLFMVSNQISLKEDILTLRKKILTIHSRKNFKKTLFEIITYIERS